mmetsp:Transcript_96956/g.134678  ORF Transcript_96956/g.134678 Transcript_96956/m.134678 type:complete len:96 (-) Transcript_96956:64-351(-)
MLFNAPCDAASNQGNNFYGFALVDAESSHKPPPVALCFAVEKGDCSTAAKNVIDNHAIPTSPTVHCFGDSAVTYYDRDCVTLGGCGYAANIEIVV